MAATRIRYERGGRSDGLPLAIGAAAAAMRAGTMSSAELLAGMNARADRLDAELGLYLAREPDIRAHGSG